jgi:hypothetical protein
MFLFPDTSYETSHGWNSEPQHIECRMSKGGIASGFAFGYDPTGRSVFFKIDRSAKSSRQAEYITSIFDTYSPPEEDSLFQSFFFDLTGRFFAGGWADLLINR